MEKTIYDLKLHESLNVGHCMVIRVPGGWLYNYAEYSQSFVPFNKEFAPKKPTQTKIETPIGDRYIAFKKLVILESKALSLPIEEQKKFAEYWGEYGTNDRKMRFEKEKTFDVKRRLKRWKDTWQKNNQDQQPDGDIPAFRNFKR